jgi:alkanesulfonate monooxygenase SsuD/methylene tetrahydromethanopterin reductase-like flavin-dependent oxidoreductase (luciferase family)
MRYGIIATVGDPRAVAGLASDAEGAGWDGVFTWDGIAVGEGDTYDPWVVMAAMAMRTERVRLGAIITPPSRRRPWKLAREASSVDRLSNGRLVLPLGLGALDDAGFGPVGEATDARIRAERLDETLDILEGLWTGEPYGHEGRHYRFAPMVFRPTPVQRPRIPIWVVGAWPHERSMRRAIRYDGIVTQTEDARQIREIAEHVSRERSAEGRTGPFEVIVQGRSPRDTGAGAAVVRPFVDAGATWWIESDWDAPTIDALRDRILAGPPRPD